jgi:transcriptional regulator with XRE-family HTH domain
VSEIAWFPGRLKELREAAGLTQKQLAAKAGMALGGLNKLEQGINKPSFESVLAICKALGVDCTAFNEPPAGREPSGRGRPAKAKAEAREGKPKRPRGRPRKE